MEVDIKKEKKNLSNSYCYNKVYLKKNNFCEDIINK